MCRSVRSYYSFVEPFTRRLWSEQDRHQGDRFRLFSAVRDAVEGDRVLYPGSFVDVAASAVYPEVTYVDLDNRTPRFFGDSDGIAEIIQGMGGNQDHVVEFLHDDYRNDLPLDPETFDVLVSLYAGFVSEHCTDYLKIGGTLLVGPSHGDAAMAAIDPRYQLLGVVLSRSGTYKVATDRLETYLVPKKPTEVTPGLLHERGRGVAYTKSPFAYLFTRVGAAAR